MRRPRPQDQPGDARASKLCRALRTVDTGVSRALGALSPRQVSALLLGTSLLFAGAMLAVSWLVKPELSQTLVLVLVALWWIPFSLLSSSAASARGRCGRRS